MFQKNKKIKNDMYMDIMKVVNSMPKNTNFFSEQAKIVLTNEIVKEIEKKYIIKEKNNDGQ
jgi:hypothetical protein|tara:strand:- start:919 stop:1101 length:183 start_codon:yes stop_codon:yes gene_type:complete